MASVQSFPTIATTSMVILLLALPPTALSQGPATPTPPTIANCVSRMLPLSPCAPFVQGTTVSPAQMCCINLKQVYSQQPDCLCLLLNSTTLSNMPINSTLALRLPALCGLQANGSACSGILFPYLRIHTAFFVFRASFICIFSDFIEGVPVPAGSQVSFGSNANSTVAGMQMT